LDTKQITILKNIGGFGFTLNSLLRDLKGFNGETVKIPINSYGGSVLDGLSIYNTITGLPYRIETSVVGYAISMGSVLMMAGDKRTMPSASYFMIHDAWAYTDGNAKELRKDANRLEMFSNDIASIYSKKTGMKKQEVRDLMEAETWLSSKDAKKYGFVDSLTKGAEIDISQISDESLYSIWDFFMELKNEPPSDVINKFLPYIENHNKPVKGEVIGIDKGHSKLILNSSNMDIFKKLLGKKEDAPKADPVAEAKKIEAAKAEAKAKEEEGTQAEDFAKKLDDVLNTINTKVDSASSKSEENSSLMKDLAEAVKTNNETTAEAIADLKKMAAGNNTGIQDLVSVFKGLVDQSDSTKAMVQTLAKKENDKKSVPSALNILGNDKKEDPFLAKKEVKDKKDSNNKVVLPLEGWMKGANFNPGAFISSQSKEVN